MYAHPATSSIDKKLYRWPTQLRNSVYSENVVTLYGSRWAHTVQWGVFSFCIFVLLGCISWDTTFGHFIYGGVLLLSHCNFWPKILLIFVPGWCNPNSHRLLFILNCYWYWGASVIRTPLPRPLFFCGKLCENIRPAPIGRQPSVARDEGL